MKSFIYFVVFVSIYFIESNLFGEAAYCNGKPDPNAKPNLNPIVTDAPVFVKEIPNAKLYTLGTGDDQVLITHLWGTPYEMGYAHASLLSDRMRAMIQTFWGYMESQIIDAINGTTKGRIRESFLKDVADFGLDVALDLEEEATFKYTGKYFFEEIKGMSDALGGDLYKRIVRIHLMGELTKGSCSMFGAWGPALPAGDGLLQLRALDWVTDGGLQDFPEITVYHPTQGSPYGHAFANIGWTGWIGSIQGYSSKQMAISEIGVSYPDETFGKESRLGVPFTYLLRDILQFDNTINDSISRISNAHRTCDLILGVGDGKSNQFRSVQYSHSVANFMDDKNLKPEGDWHPKISNIVYHGMDWLCKSFNEVLAKQLTTLYGNLTAENAIRNVTSIVQTGSLITTYYDLTRNVVYTANARGSHESGPGDAFDRTFLKVNMANLFAEQPPTL